MKYENNSRNTIHFHAEISIWSQFQSEVRIHLKHRCLVCFILESRTGDFFNSSVTCIQLKNKWAGNKIDVEKTFSFTNNIYHTFNCKTRCSSMVNFLVNWWVFYFPKGRFTYRLHITLVMNIRITAMNMHYRSGTLNSKTVNSK